MSSQLDVRLGCQQPTVQHLPEGRHANRADEVIDLAGIAGLELDPWQQDVLRGSMWTDRSERWCSLENVCIVPRQNGKGSILEARQIGGLFVLGERLQIHTAHEFKTCYEHFRRVVSLVENTPILSRQVKIIRTGAGDQAIELKTGARLRFIARSRSSGRGFSGTSVYLDEAFKLDDETMGALLPTLSAQPDPQLWYTSSAPHHDSPVLHRLRQRGVGGAEPRMFYAEWSNEPGTSVMDVDAWYRANPALGIRIGEDHVAAEARSMSVAEFERERLGVPESPTGETGVIPLEAWYRCVGDHAPTAPLTLSVDCNPDRVWASIGVADARGAVELIERAEGVAWVADRIAELAKRHKARVAVDVTGPLAALATQLPLDGIDVVPIPGVDVMSACQQFLDAVVAGGVRVRQHQQLDLAAGAVGKASNGDRWRFARKSHVDISPLMAVVLAWWAAREHKPQFFVY